MAQEDHSEKAIGDLSIQQVVEHLKSRLKYTTLIGEDDGKLYIWTEARSNMELEGVLSCAHSIETDRNIGL